MKQLEYGFFLKKICCVSNIFVILQRFQLWKGARQLAFEWGTHQPKPCISEAFDF